MSGIIILDRTQKVDLVMTSGTVLRGFSIAAIPALVRNGKLFKEIQGTVIAWDGEKQVPITGVNVVKALTGTLKVEETQATPPVEAPKPEKIVETTETPKPPKSPVAAKVEEPEVYQRMTDYNPDQKIEVIKNGKLTKVTLREYMVVEMPTEGKEPIVYAGTPDSKATFSINGEAFEISGGELMALLNDLKIANFRQESVFALAHKAYDRICAGKIPAKEKKLFLAQRNRCVAAAWVILDQEEDTFISTAIKTSGIKKAVTAHKPASPSQIPAPVGEVEEKLPHPTPGQPAFTAPHLPGIRESLALLGAALKRTGLFAISEIRRAAKEYCAKPSATPKAQNPSNLGEKCATAGRLGGIGLGVMLLAFSKEIKAIKAHIAKMNEPSLSAISPPVITESEPLMPAIASSDRNVKEIIRKACKVAAVGAVVALAGLVIYQSSDKEDPSKTSAQLPVSTTPVTAEPAVAVQSQTEVNTKVLPVILNHGAFIDFLRDQSGNPTATVTVTR